MSPPHTSQVSSSPERSHPLSQGTLERLLKAIDQLATQAGELIMRRYEQPLEVMEKADSSPVTLADQEANELIVSGLRALEPSLPIVAEESVEAGDVPTLEALNESLGEAFWLVDPLDGTKEFINKNGDFTVNIALIVRGEPCLGVVYVPALNTTYLGHVGRHAMKREVRRAEGGQLTKAALSLIHTRPRPTEGAVVMTSRSHRSPETDALLAKLHAPQELSRGSSLKLCLIAEGVADLYPRLGRTMEWDIAAAQAVLVAAGGVVETLEGEPLRYGKNSTFENPHFIAKGEASPLS